MPTLARSLAPVLRTPSDDGEQVTQLLAGEPAVVLEGRDGWSRVVAPWQPSSLDPAGYPGWVRDEHLRAGEEAAPPAYPSARECAGADLVASAGEFLGTAYQWGGMTVDGVDCSGLVHAVTRSFGLRVARDAVDQAATLPPVGLHEVRPGDLYFFARTERGVHHVGFVSAPVADDGARRMLHAPDVGDRRHVVEEVLDEDRSATLVGAARIPGVLA